MYPDTNIRLIGLIADLKEDLLELEERIEMLEKRQGLVYSNGPHYIEEEK